MSNTSSTTATFANTNRWDTRQLVTMALMCAIATLLSFVEFPFGVAWLKYDASFVPSLVTGFAYGAGPGVLVGTACAVIHGLIMGDWVGSIMNIIITVATVAPAAIIYRRRHTWSGAVIGLVVALVCATVAAIAANLAIDPFYLGMPFEAVLDLVIPVLLPFNIMKAAINAVLTVIVYKAVSNLITPKKKQVRGR